MKINIAIVINSIKKNGPGKVVLNLIKNLNKDMFNVTLITIFDSNDKSVINDLNKKDIKTLEFKSKNKINFLIKDRKKINKFLEEKYFDIIHTHGIVPDCVSASCNTKAKKITTIHCNMYEDYNRYNFIIKQIMIFLQLRVFRKLDKCICCSKSVYYIMKKKIQNIDYVVNGIDAEQTNNKVITRSMLDIPNESFLFVYAGELSEGKNILNLVKQFKKVHTENEYLLILGEGTKYEECKKECDSNIKLIGYQSNPEDYFNIADIYTSASKSEGMSIAIIEALDKGLKLFLSDIPSHKEIFEINKNIYLGELFDTNNFKEKYFNIISKKDKVKKQEIINFKKENLSSKRMTDEYTKIYKNLLKEKDEKGQYNCSGI